MDDVVELELVDRAVVELSEAVANMLEQRPQLNLVIGTDQLSSGLPLGALCCTADTAKSAGYERPRRVDSAARCSRYPSSM